mmetsp:Transcript_44562/g.74337  ORF Transcript_44562/g.74337 Transcript_44562/m.74337 type:complete len:91 (+) Transcript_44562:1092-1364(+)
MNLFRKKRKRQKSSCRNKNSKENLYSAYIRGNVRRITAKKKKQIGGTSGFSFRGMREDRQFNKKEAKNMKNAGKDLMMSFGPGSLYKSGL